MTDPDDPLRGLDPYPRERIEGLHQERAQLLEEIVSTPGPSKASTPSKVLLAIGVAAALVIVGGGGWLLGNAGGDDSGDQVAAAGSTSSTAPASTQATEPSKPTASTSSAHTESPTRPQHAVKVVGHRCDKLRTRDLQHVLRARSQQLKGVKQTRGARYYLVMRRNGCVLELGPRHHH